MENNEALDPDQSHEAKAGLSPLMAIEARMNAQGFLIEVLFYQMFKDQGANAVQAKAFFNKLRRVPALKSGDPFIEDEAAMPFVAVMDDHFRYVRDRVGQWLKQDEDKGQESKQGEAVPQNSTPTTNIEEQDNGLLPGDPSFEDVQNFMADELEDLIDNPTLKDKIKGIFGHDE